MQKSPNPERRRHIVYVTRNTEYHCRGRECVGVRDRGSGRWVREHPALRASMLGAVHRGEVQPRPEKGLRLLFTGVEQLVMTSKLLCAGRPEREDVFAYTSLCWSGEIA
jgi:hypothetical protein